MTTTRSSPVIRLISVQAATVIVRPAVADTPATSADPPASAPERASSLSDGA
jgi:hypothetical protein